MGRMFVKSVQLIRHSNKSEMNAEQQQKHFNEIAEMMADNKITT